MLGGNRYRVSFEGDENVLELGWLHSAVNASDLLTKKKKKKGSFYIMWISPQLKVEEGSKTGERR